MMRPSMGSRSVRASRASLRASQRSASWLARRSRFACAVLCAAFAVLSSCSHPRRPGVPPKNLLLITFDALRPDHLSCYGALRQTGGIPRGPEDGADELRVTFDDLAESGVMFANAYAPSSATVPSLAALFTGRGPLESGVVDDRSSLPAEVPTLAESLARAGFATAACVTLHRADPRVLPTRGFESVATESDDAATIDRAVEWLHRDLGSGQPFFLWVHLAGLAPDWKAIELAPPARRRVFTGSFGDREYRGPANGTAAYFERVEHGELAPSSDDAAHTIDLYDTEVAHVLGQATGFLRRAFAYEASEIEATECWSRTLLVLTSPRAIELYDHGVPHPARLHESELRVPLILRHPDSLTGERVLANAVELEDVMPTVLEWFELAIPSGVRGRSLLACTDKLAHRAFADHPMYSSLGEQSYSVRTPRWRLIWSPYAKTADGAPAPAAYLFDHAEDPLELRDVSRENGVIVRELEDEIRAWRKAQNAPHSP
jgi:arylsulfatase A-like enzyme